jgi:hypothetical protein
MNFNPVWAKINIRTLKIILFDICEFLENQAGKTFFSYGLKLNYNYMRTMNPYEILQVKNSFVN